MKDLQLEVCGIAAPELDGLDFSGLEFRHLYFIRRVVATLHEFTCALDHLIQSQEFNKILKRFSTNERKSWKESVAFFRRHKETFGNTRDDISAHFQAKISEYSIKNIDHKSPAKLEILKGQNRKVAIKFRFVDELIATAITHRRGDKAPQEFINYLVKLTREGQKQATIPARVIFHYLISETR